MQKLGQNKTMNGIDLWKEVYEITFTQKKVMIFTFMSPLLWLWKRL
jgi:hypothetical protein